MARKDRERNFDRERGYDRERGMDLDRGNEFERAGPYERDWNWRGGERGETGAWREPEQMPERGRWRGAEFGRGAGEGWGGWPGETGSWRQRYGRGGEWGWRGADTGWGAEGYGRGEGGWAGGQFASPRWREQREGRTWGGPERYRGGERGWEAGWGTRSDYGDVGRGGFYGRGPRAYQRPDERIEEEVCRVLTDDPEIDASEIEVKVNNGQVTLSGAVDDRRAKRRAEEMVENLWGVRDVRNEMRVTAGEGERETETTRRPTGAETGGRRPTTGTRRAA